jgi:hypothetical protein
MYCLLCFSLDDLLDNKIQYIPQELFQLKNLKTLFLNSMSLCCFAVTCIIAERFKATIFKRCRQKSPNFDSSFIFELIVCDEQLNNQTIEHSNIQTFKQIHGTI